MRETGIESLTDGQKQCLRLVFQHMQSKEIARALGISVATVNQRIDGARAKLGNVSRVAAALALAAAEGASVPDPILYDRTQLAPTASDVEPSASIDAGSATARFLPWPVSVGAVNDYSPARRLVAICVVAVLGLLVVALLVSIMNGIGVLVGR